MGRFYCFMLPEGYGRGPRLAWYARSDGTGTYRPRTAPSSPRGRVGVMRTRRVRGKALLVTAAALALAAGCSSGGGAAGAPGVEKPDLNVAVVPALDSAGFFVALYQGLFKAQGLNVHFTAATSSEAVIANQAQGSYDITGGNYVSYIQAQQRGEANLKIFAEGSVMQPGAQGIYTMPDTPVRTLADLKGKTVAINASRNILYLLAASVLAEHGINPGLVHFINVQFPGMAADLKSGTISAAVLPEPFASGAEEGEGAVPLVDLNQGATAAFPVAGYVVTKPWAQKYPHTLAAFYKALEEGQQIADASRDSVEQAMMNLPGPFGVSRQTAAVLAVDSYPFSTGPVGSVDRVRLQRVVNVMRQFIGFGKFDIGSMLMGSG
jgi:NitT/TauT family transport system substrate-binding protein